MEQNRVYETSPQFEGVVTVTPEIAKEWLSKQHDNRELNKSNWEAYKRNMLNGTFQWNAQSMAIVFSNEGNIIDGQHRLKAMAEGNITHPMIIFKDSVLKCATEGIFDRGALRKEYSLSKLTKTAFTVANIGLKNYFPSGKSAVKWTLTEKETAFNSFCNYPKFKENFDIFNGSKPAKFTVDVFWGTQLAYMHGVLNAFDILLDARKQNPETLAGSELKRHILLPSHTEWLTATGSKIKVRHNEMLVEVFLVLIGKNPNYYKKLESRIEVRKQIRSYLAILLHDFLTTDKEESNGKSS